MSPETYLVQLEGKLKNQYDLERNTSFHGAAFDLQATFRIRNERYIVSKKAVVYAVEAAEYHFIRITTALPSWDEISALLNLFEAHYTDLVTMHEDHMNSIIQLTFIVEDIPADKSYRQKVQKLNKQISSFLGLKGWVDFGVMFYSVTKQDFLANRIGKKMLDAYSI